MKTNLNDSNGTWITKWDVFTLDRAPSMNHTCHQITGTFEDAVELARAFWKASPQSMPSVRHFQSTVTTFRIAPSGEWIDRSFPDVRRGVVA